jgi:uncharacterized membrane protein YkvA (DUF1232 family)
MNTSIKNFKVLLLNLAERSDETFAAEIRRRMRVGKRSKAVQRLKDFILVIPDMISQLRIGFDVAKDNPALRRLHGFMMTYLYHPLDFVPDDDKGLFGYLDDAYFIGNIYHRMMLHLEAQKQQALSGANAFEQRIRPWLRLTRKVLPQEAARIDRMLDDLSQAECDSFYAMMGREAKTLLMA